MRQCRAARQTSRMPRDTNAAPDSDGQQPIDPRMLDDDGLEPQVDPADEDPMLDPAARPPTDDDEGVGSVRFGAPIADDEGHQPDTGYDRQRRAIEVAHDAKSRARSATEQDREIGNSVDAWISSNRKGFIDIERDGPPGLPQSEYGVLDTCPVSRIGSRTMAEYISENYGGGSFRLLFRRNDRTFANVPEEFLRVKGDIIPQTAAGKKWLKKQQAEDEADVGGGGIAKLLEMMHSQQVELQKELRRVQEASERRIQEILERQRAETMESAKDQTAIQLERIRAEEVRQAKDLELQRSREETERQIRLKKMEEDAATAREEMKARLERENREFQERMAREADERKKERMLEREERRRERRIEEIKMTGGLGFKGQTRLMMNAAETAQEMALSKMKEQLGIEDEKEGEGGVMESLIEAVKPAIPKLLDLAMSKMGQAGPSAPPAALPSRPAALPGRAPAIDLSGSMAPPAAPQAIPAPADAPAPPTADAPAPAAPAPEAVPSAAPPAPVGPDPKFEAATAAQFFAGVLFVCQNRPEPDLAWGMQLAQDGRDLDALYGQMTPRLRDAFQADPATFLRSIAPAMPPALIQRWNALNTADPSTTEYLVQVHAAGPWNDAGDEEDEDGDAV